MAWYATATGDWQLTTFAPTAMQLGTVIGHATSTIKHRSLNGWKLSVVQPLNVRREPEADPIIAVDKLGSSPGQIVILNSDGKGARELVGDDKSPVRYFVIGIVDGEGNSYSK